MRRHLRWLPNGEFLEVIQMEISSNDFLATTDVSSPPSLCHTHSQTDKDGFECTYLLHFKQLVLAPDLMNEITTLLSGINSLGTAWRENLVCEPHQLPVDLDPSLCDVRSDLVLIKPKSEKSLDVSSGGNLPVPSPRLTLHDLPKWQKAGRTHIVLQSPICLVIGLSRDLNAGVKKLSRDSGRGRLTAPSRPSMNCDIRNWFSNQNNSLPGAGWSAARHRHS